MLEGKNAPTVCGSQAARQLRAVLMARCQQTVPIIQRLQAEARAVQTAAERQHIDANEYAAFEQTDVSVKAEIDAVKLEAEWLSDDSGTRQGMGEPRRARKESISIFLTTYQRISLFGRRLPYFESEKTLRVSVQGSPRVCYRERSVAKARPRRVRWTRPRSSEKLSTHEIIIRGLSLSRERNSKTTTQGEQVWPAAFQIYAKRDAASNRSIDVRFKVGLVRVWVRDPRRVTRRSMVYSGKPRDPLRVV